MPAARARLQGPRYDCCFPAGLMSICTQRNVVQLRRTSIWPLHAWPMPGAAGQVSNHFGGASAPARLTAVIKQSQGLREGTGGCAGCAGGAAPNGAPARGQGAGSNRGGPQPCCRLDRRKGLRRYALNALNAQLPMPSGPNGLKILWLEARQRPGAATPLPSPVGPQLTLVHWERKAQL